MSDKNEFNELINSYYESWFRINSIYHVWSRKHGIQDTTLLTLYVIKETSPFCTQNELCERLLFPKQPVSLILSELEKKGYILRELNPQDRRNKIVKFTSQGAQYANNILEELKSVEIEAFNNLPQEKRRSIIESFSLLSNSLEKSFSK